MGLGLSGTNTKYVEECLERGMGSQVDVISYPANLKGVAMGTRSRLSIPLMLVAMAAPTASLNAGESLFFGEKEDWTNNRLIAGEDGSLGLIGGQLTYSAETFPVDTTATATLSGEFKRLPGAGDKDRFFFALLSFDKEGKRIEGIHVNPVPGSDTELAAPCTAADEVIRLKNGENFKKGSCVAFHTKDDYQDLPNRNVNGKAPVTGSEKSADGMWQVTLKAPIGIEAPAGTRVRDHHGGGYLYAGAFSETIPDDWRKFEGTIQGTEPGDHRNRWRPGTAYVQMIVFGSGPSREPFLAFRNVRFQCTSGSSGDPASASETVVHIPKGTVVTHIPLRPTKDGQDLSVRFANGSFRKISITPFDETIKSEGQDIVLPAAGVEIQPFNVRYTMRPGALPTGQVTVAQRIKNWGQEADLYGKQFILSLRQRSGAVEFCVNGSYIGTMKRESRAAAVRSRMKIENVSFRSEAFPDGFVPIDISSKGRPGTMEGARLALFDKKVPFITADGKSLDMGVTAKQASLGGGQTSLAETPASFTFTVPCAQYTRA